MTDFDKKAREIVNADNWPDVQCTVGGANGAALIIAAALKEAYNEGLDTADEVSGDLGDTIIGCFTLSEILRAKKVPT